MKITSPVLKRLGPVPFWRGERRCLDELAAIYAKAAAAAQAALGVAVPVDASTARASRRRDSFVSGF